MKDTRIMVLENGNKVISTFYTISKGNYVWTESEFNGAEIIRYKDVTETPSGTIEIYYDKVNGKITNYIQKVA